MKRIFRIMGLVMLATAVLALVLAGPAQAQSSDLLNNTVNNIFAQCRTIGLVIAAIGIIMGAIMLALGGSSTRGRIRGMAIVGGSIGCGILVAFAPEIVSWGQSFISVG